MTKIKKRFYWEKNPDGSRKKIYYYPVTHAQAVQVDDQGNTLDEELTQISQQVGDLNNLETPTKDNLVGAINEAYNHGGGGGYNPPVGGIPKTDLARGVQESLNRADTALQVHQDISGLATKAEIIQIDQ